MASVWISAELLDLIVFFGELCVQSHVEKSHRNADIYRTLSEHMKVGSTLRAVTGDKSKQRNPSRST